MNSSLRNLTAFWTVAICLLCAVAFSTAQPRWQWVKTAVGPTFDEGRALCQGPDGDLHVIGVFYDSIAFGSQVLPAIGNYDVFTSRYTNTGVLRDWDSYGGLYNDDAKSMAVDNKGNFYVCGFFNEAMNCGGQILEGLGDAASDDIFVAKFDKVGVLVWSKVFGSPEADDDIPYIAIDSLGNVYLTGGFGLRAEFDSREVTSKGKQDIYVAKLNSLGVTTWVKSYGSTENDLGRSIAVSANGDRIYIGGTFIGPVSFDIKEITSYDQRADIVVQCFGANGQVLWVERIGSQVPDEHISVASDKDGKLILTGALYDQSTFFGKPMRANGEFFSDMFLSRVTKDGAVEFVKTYGGPYDDVGLDVIADSRGAFYVAGRYDSTSKFGGTIVNSAGGTDAFAARFFPNGDFEWIRTAGGVHDDQANGIVVSKDGIPFVVGTYDTEAWFEGFLITGELTDMFFAALECGPDTDMNPPTGPITICEGQDSMIVVRSGYPSYEWYSNGAVVSSGTYNRFDLSKLPQGTYSIYARVTDFYSCALNSDTISVTITEGLPVPVITRLGNDLSCSVADVMYQWYREGNPISGATASYVTINGEGNYRVLISDNRGCSRWSDNFLVGTTGVAGEEFATGIYPNPFNESFTVLGWEGASITVIDLLGNVVARIENANATQAINIAGAAGSYLVRISTPREQRSTIISKH